jgi:hypothetical protein
VAPIVLAKDDRKNPSKKPKIAPLSNVITNTPGIDSAATKTYRRKNNVAARKEFSASNCSTY